MAPVAAVAEGSLPAVHLLLPTLGAGDAAGSHTLQLQQALRDAGMECELFVEHRDESFAGMVHHYSELGSFCRPGRTALVYQLAIGSPVADMLLDRAEPLIVNYHNLTPASFFWQWDPGLVDGIVWGHRQLHQLVPRTVHAIGVSELNRRDLERAGYSSTAVSPPLVRLGGGWESLPDSAPARANGDTRGARTARGEGARWLFVGRLAPNKAAHDLVKALYAYRRAYDPGARLVLVGGQGHPLYTAAIKGLVDALGLVEAVELAGAVDDESLAGYYASADIFVCLSDHEGFCFPLLEAMGHDLPVVAYGAGAVPETLGAAGLVLPVKSPAVVAAAVHQVLSGSPGLRRRLVAASRERLGVFSLERERRAMVAEVMKGLALAGLLDHHEGSRPVTGARRRSVR